MVSYPGHTPLFSTHPNFLHTAKDGVSASAGVVPQLFTKEDFREILQEISPRARSEGVPEQGELLLAFFWRRVQRNLLVILCLSPDLKTLRSHMLLHPGEVFDLSAPARILSSTPHLHSHVFRSILRLHLPASFPALRICTAMFFGPFDLHI